MGSWKGDSNPGGPGGRTRRIQTGGGSKPPKKSSGGASGAMLFIAVSLLVVPASVALGLVAYLIVY